MFSIAGLHPSEWCCYEEPCMFFLEGKCMRGQSFEGDKMIEDPQVSMGFNIKMVIHDLDDLGVPHFRSNGALKHQWSIKHMGHWSINKNSGKILGDTEQKLKVQEPKRDPQAAVGHSEFPRVVGVWAVWVDGSCDDVIPRWHLPICPGKKCFGSGRQKASALQILCFRRSAGVWVKWCDKSINHQNFMGFPEAPDVMCSQEAVLVAKTANSLMSLARTRHCAVWLFGEAIDPFPPWPNSPV